jgi:hypothetical protein
MASTPIEIPIKLNGLAAIKAELRELKGELANATDPKQMQELAQRAGELKDQLADANEQVAVFASGSKFEQVSNSFGSMKDSLMSLDFEEAAQKAKMFQQTLGSISPATIGNSIKGLISVVGSLSKAFVQFGVALLANPIFLLVAAIVAIVAIIGVVMNKLGILKPVLNAIGKAFEFIGDIIDVVIQGLKDFTDWLGITNNAAEDAADAQAAAAEKTADAYEEKSKKVVAAYDREIELAELDGKNTVKLEKEKQIEILKTAEARLEAIKKKVLAAQISGDLDKDEVIELRKTYNEQVQVVEDAKHKIEVIDKKESNRKKEERTKESEEETKSTQDTAKRAQEAYKARIAAEKQFRADRLAAIRQIEDLETSLMVEGVQKEIVLNQTKYKRILEDLQANAKLTSDEKIRLAALYAEEEFQADKALRQKYQVDLDAAVQTSKDNRAAQKAEQLALEAETYAKMGAMMKENALKEIAEAKAVAEAKAAIQKEDIDRVSAGIGVIKSIFEKNKAVQKAALIAENAIGVAKVIISTAAANAAALATPQAIATSGAAAIPVIARNKISAGISIASIVASTAKGLSALGGGGTVGGTAPGGGGGGGTSTSQATPQVNLFGANNNANTFGANGQQSNQGGEMVVKAVVVESDVTSMQKKMNKVQESAVL